MNSKTFIDPSDAFTHLPKSSVAAFPSPSRKHAIDSAINAANELARIAWLYPTQENVDALEEAINVLRKFRN